MTNSFYQLTGHPMSCKLVVDFGVVKTKIPLAWKARGVAAFLKAAKKFRRPLLVVLSKVLIRE